VLLPQPRHRLLRAGGVGLRRARSRRGPPGAAPSMAAAVFFYTQRLHARYRALPPPRLARHGLAAVAVDSENAPPYRGRPPLNTSRGLQGRRLAISRSLMGVGSFSRKK
jgi:hypothetical protein